MTTTADMRYGRQGGRWKAAPKPEPQPKMLLADPAGIDELLEHLIVWHGVPATELAGQPPSWVEAVHHGEHRSRDSLEYIGHRHPTNASERAAAAVTDAATMRAMRRAFAHTGSDR